MRSDIRRALRFVAYAAVQLAKYEGQREQQPLAEILTALTEATPKELRARKGPRTWARALLTRRHPNERPSLPHSRAAVARLLVSGIEGWLKSQGVFQTPHLWRKHLLAQAVGDEPSFVERVLVVVTMDAALVWGPPQTEDLDKQEKLVGGAIEKVTRRNRFNAEHIAIAVLVGWGLTRQAARDAFKNV